MNGRGRRSGRGVFPIVMGVGFAVWIGGVSVAGELGRAASPHQGDRWLYCSFNLQVDKSADDLIALIDRASGSGIWTLLSDYKFQVLYRVTDNYFRNVEHVRAAACGRRSS